MLTNSPIQDTRGSHAVLPKAHDALAVASRIGNLFLPNVTATPANTTGSDQAQSPSHETAAAPTMPPAKKPMTRSNVFFSRSLAPSISG